MPPRAGGASRFRHLARFLTAACQSASWSLAEPPLTVIQARPGWKFVDLGEMWRYRELLYFLVWRDVMVRYKQTVLGVAWAILQPLATMVVFSLFFGRLAELPSGSVPYALFVFAGLLPWTFFANGSRRPAAAWWAARIL